MLVVESIDARYGHVHALRDVSLRVDSGEIVALFGANGAGKTTTLRAISGLINVEAGIIKLDDRNITNASPEKLAETGVAHIPEGRGIFGKLSVRQNLKMGGYAKRLPQRTLDASINDVIEMFPRLGERLEQTAGTLSGGEQQMLAIARALIMRPRLLLIDEPSHGLAPNIVSEVFERLEHVRETGTAILVVEQFASVALEAASRAYVLERGRVVYDGDALALRHDPSALHGAYLGAGAR
ncbi:MAG: ABC transporter ATP-binding protein [Actinomycetota bacterium]